MAQQLGYNEAVGSAMGRGDEGWGRMRPLDAWCWVAMLLLALFADVTGSRRGAGGRAGGRGGGGGLRGGFRAISRGTGGTPGRGSKVAGAIAAGAAAGYGMGLLGRPRPSRLGHGIPVARQPSSAGGFHAPSWPDLGGKRGTPSPAPRPGATISALLLGSTACILLQR
ncbi:shadow of prion protein-like [Calypte anna]|uniref:shadow of prion protein-like n=1 Tax=Calypte anna TaxID=9244 RepID=UPI0011C3B10D|nr:shadow of prion protein-like [Calypte anna]